MRSCPYCGREWQRTAQDDESSYITVFSTHTKKELLAENKGFLLLPVGGAKSRRWGRVLDSAF